MKFGFRVNPLLSSIIISPKKNVNCKSSSKYFFTRIGCAVAGISYTRSSLQGRSAFSEQKSYVGVILSDKMALVFGVAISLKTSGKNCKRSLKGM